MLNTQHVYSITLFFKNKMCGFTISSMVSKEVSEGSSLELVEAVLNMFSQVYQEDFLSA